MGVAGHDLTRNMSFEVVGREEDRATVEAFVGQDDCGAAAFVLEGEPGIGKSTLWLAAVAAARRRGMIVLSSRPAESERGLAYVGLGDLFDRGLDDVIAELSPPRRRALEVALCCGRRSATERRSLPTIARSQWRYATCSAC